MSALLFPTADALRLALAAGVIPPAVARGPVAAGRGDGGELWLTPSVPLPADLLTALARFGVRVHAPPPGFQPAPFPCWAAPLPLRSDSAPPAGPTLVRLPAARLAGFVAAVQRLQPQPVKFLPDRPDALCLLPHPPAHLLDTPDVTAYHHAAEGVWVRAGWQHPLPAALAVPAGSVAFVGPPADWRLHPTPPFLDPADLFPLRVRPPLAAVVTGPPPVVSVPVKLRSHSSDAAETLWAFDGPPERLAELFRTTDERVLARFQFAVVEAGGVKRVWAKPAGRGKTPLLPEPFRGFVPHPLLAGVFLPAGKVFAPSPRADRLAELLAVNANHWVCVESTAVHRLPPSAFRPLAALVEHTAPAARPLTAWAGTDTRLSFAEVRLADAAEPPVSLPPVHVPPAAVPPVHPHPSWFGRLADKLLGGKKPAERAKPVAATGKRSSRVITPAARRPPPDRDARRRLLEQAVLERRGGAEVWVELAGVNADAGKRADAALCWVNALWDADPPPTGWVGEWVMAEQRGQRNAIDPRLAAAVVAEIGFSPDPHPDANRLPYLVRLIDAHEGELPVRAVWLARLAAARAVGGDPLGLARCRDRLLARLAADGPSLDLDAPAFLRFHGTIDGDRFRATREWLLHVREPIRRWLESLSTGQRLGWAGLDPDPKPTTAYADLMLAWGLSRLGERTKADKWADEAGRVLERAGGYAVDPAVHAALLARFRGRIRDAQHGRGRQPAATDTPPPPLDADSAYMVAKLAERSRILAPHPPNPYDGLDLDPLLGTDPLAHRIKAVRRQPSAEGVAAVLADTAADPTAAVLPRVVLAAVELPVTFPAKTADRLMLLLPRAVELLPEAVRLTSDPHADAGAYLQRLANRAVQAACRLAIRYDLNGGFGAFVRSLLDAVAAGDTVVKAATEAHLGDLFTALRKLGLLDLAGELAGAWADKPIGWYVMGRDETGWALLDAARERLFVTGIPDDRTRTAAAFEYVAALAHAPPRLALGRLEELFQELKGVITAGGTARYFALTPLELIDRAVSAVVTDEFNLGPAVRRWLDDDEHLIRRRIAADLDAALAAGG